MPKSEFAKAVDEIQTALRSYLKPRGFRVRGRTFNRATDDGLTEVINLQMGPSDPPGTTYIPGLRENMHGLFTVNLGVYVPEVAKHRLHGDRFWIQEYHCCVRARFGDGKEKDFWWRASPEEVVITDVRRALERQGLPFLARFSSRDRILAEWRDRSENMGASDPPRIVKAIILTERGETRSARELLAQQAAEARGSGHANYVRELAGRLGIGSLDG